MILDMLTDLTSVYNAKKCALIPGSGTMGMEAVARQFGTNKSCLVIRNGFFSFRWSQIFEMGHIPSNLTVLKASFNNTSRIVTPPPIEIVVKNILEQKPSLVCLPHVETSVGILVTDKYISAICEATRKVGG